MSDAVSTQGTVITIGGVAIAEIKDWSGPDQSRNAIDVTSLDSTDKEFIYGLRDNGQVTINYLKVVTDAGQVALQAALDAMTVATFTVVLTDAGNDTYSFSGLVTNIAPSGSTDDALVESATIKVTGEITKS